MALRDLAGSGADCGPVNPLAGLAKQFDVDRSLQRDAALQRAEGTRGMRGSALLAGPSSAGARPNLEEEFFAQQQHQQHGHLQHQHNASPFAFGEMQHELGRMHQGDWAGQFMHDRGYGGAMSAMDQSHFEAAYREIGGSSSSSSAAAMQQQHWSEEYAQFHGGNMAASGGVLPHDEMERIYNEAAATEGATGNWADEFALDRADEWISEFVAQQQQQTEDRTLEEVAGNLVDSIDDEKLMKSNFMQFMHQIRSRQVTIEDNKVVPGPAVNAVAAAATSFEAVRSTTSPDDLDWAREFAGPSAARQISKNAQPLLVDPDTEARSWAEEYTLSEEDRQQSAAEGRVFSEEELAKFQEAYSRANVGPGQTFEEWTKMYHPLVDPLRDEHDEAWDKLEKGWQTYKHEGWGYEGYNKEMYATYIFSTTNPFLNTSNPQADAQNLLQQHRIVEAILALESEVQRHPENSQAWFLLGKAQAMNEKDVLAIAALQKSLNLDATNMEGWLHLAASYTNENCRPEAFKALESLLRNNPKYKDIMSKPLDHPNRHTELVHRFIDAARLYPSNIDPDVQISLGVLFNISNEYEKAVDCFNAALSVRGNDAMLWNRLGASLANGGSPELAVDAYYKALEENSMFIRARYNLGVCCISMGAHKEAAEHFLSALSIQTAAAEFEASSARNSSRTTSSTIWDALRITFVTMDRSDLASKCDGGDLDSFRNEFDFM